ncbi:MAG TPA: NADH-quinone oxidoreductase subunit NuoH [Chthonomonadales bacterium]|nr:NADH-quinone oxidoreductase subunit NuoH [Chthonomonadales bacterium]
MVIDQYVRIGPIGPIDIVPLIPYASMLAIIGFILISVVFVIWMERVVLALVQNRLGPNRVGPRGLLQSIADAIKLFFKEDTRPAGADRTCYYVAPALVMIPALAAGATLPFGTITVRTEAGPQPLPLIVGDVNVGILFILALASLQVYGTVLAGWSANNKYSLLGGLRAAAQAISYELAMSIAVVTAVLIAGSLQLTAIVDQQSGYIWGWLPNWTCFQFYGLGMVATLIYLVAMVAETNRAPFDMPEAESELVAGFHTEYSSMKFAIFFVGEYASMLVVSGVATALWFGGWHAPLPFLQFIPGWIWFVVKVMAIMLTFMWIRASLPRLRYDALMAIGWKRMIPLATVVLLAVAAVDAFNAPVIALATLAAIVAASFWLGWRAQRGTRSGSPHTVTAQGAGGAG